MHTDDAGVLGDDAEVVAYANDVAWEIIRGHGFTATERQLVHSLVVRSYCRGRIDGLERGVAAIEAVFGSERATGDEGGEG